MDRAIEICESHDNYVIETGAHDTQADGLQTLLRAAHRLINPRRIVRPDGVVIACSYDGFTSSEQAAKNGREELL